MGAEIPQLSEQSFRRRLLECAPPVSEDLAHRLYLHFQLLRRWNRSVSLIGPGTVKDVVERHYAESLAARPWLEGVRGAALDVGSGAGFPGLVLAAACPQLRVTLCEARERKAVFLEMAARRAGVPCSVLGLRVEDPLPDALPERVECLFLRALKLEASTWRALIRGPLSDRGQVFVWGTEEPRVPGLTTIDSAPLLGGVRRRLWVLQPSASRAERP